MHLFKRVQSRTSFLKPSSVWLVLCTILALTGCAKHVEQKKEVMHSIPADKHTLLSKYTAPYIAAHPDKTGFYPLSDGQEAYFMRLAMIYSAEQSLDIQYYIYRDDSTSSLMTWYLYQAAERGVRVRILLDDMQARNDAALAKLAAHPNVELRLFNPFENRSLRAVGFLGDFNRLNRRMHNKAIIADGAFAIIGGRNIGDEYFSANNNVEFGDIDLLLLGKVIPDVAQQFDVYWNSEPATPVEHLIDTVKPVTEVDLEAWKESKLIYLTRSDYAKSLKELPVIKRLMEHSLPLYWSDVKLSYDSPNKVNIDSPTNQSDDGLLLHKISAVLQQTEKSLLIISPYFVPTEEGAKALADAASQGLDITVITNSLASNDVFSVHGWYAKRREILLNSGVKLYEVKVGRELDKKHSWLGSSRTSLHAKIFIIDEYKTFVGSYNFDPRSAYLNTEMGVFVDSPQFAEQSIQAILSSLKKTTYRLKLDDDGDIAWVDDVTGKQFDTEPDSSIWLRFGAWFSGLLPIEKHL
jgi:cardiolipin synthase C